MKAIVINQLVDDPTDLTISSIPPPTIHHPSQVLVTIQYAAINYVDLHYARGLHQNNTSLVRPPFTLGLEFAGTVADAAPSSRWRCGDRVFGAGLGAFAEQIVINEDRLHEILPAWIWRGQRRWAPPRRLAMARWWNGES